MKTQCAILVQQKKPLEIDEVEIPQLSYGQVLVEVHVSRICGSQLGEIDGVKGPDAHLPHLLGHEGGGIVVETGPEVRHVKKGDRVVLHWRKGAGIDSRTPVYLRGSTKVNAGWVTTFQQYAVVSENRVTRIPDTISFETAALLADTLTTGFGMITNDAQVKIGETVVVVGSGGIGLGAVLGAKLAGAYPIIAVDLYDHKLEKATKYGASHTINAKKCDLVEGVKQILGNRKAEVVVDGTGNPDIIDRCLELTDGSVGRCVIFGVMHHTKKLSLNTSQFHFGKVLTGSWGGSSKPDLEIPRYVRMLENMVFDPADFVTHRVQLEDINDTITKMRAGEVLHAMVHFDR